MFYRENTFFFLGQHGWTPIASWLDTIGPENRDCLSNLEINAYMPDKVWQQFGEARVEPVVLDWRIPSHKEPIYPRNPSLGWSMRPRKYGLVDNINPSIESIFERLGTRSSVQKVLLNFKLPSHYPGQGTMYEEECPENGWHSMDLPSLVEKFQRLHTDQSTTSGLVSSAEVIWTGKFLHEVWMQEYNQNVPSATIQNQLQNTKHHG